MLEKRIRKLKYNSEVKQGTVAYWMTRDQRINNNWSLIASQKIAQKNKAAFAIIFCLNPSFLDATLRQYDFMLKGLQEIAKDAKSKNIPFYILKGTPEKEIPTFCTKYKITDLITDFSPLKIAKQWKEDVLDKVSCNVFEIDAHNVIPVWLTSQKQEFAARTIRPKINKLLAEFLTEFPSTKKQTTKWLHTTPKISWKALYSFIKVNQHVAPAEINPGPAAAKKQLTKFISHKLSDYSDDKNDPSLDGLSNLSPYLHFGHISAQEVALKIQASKAPKKAKEVFLEELIVRKELSDNFCHYNKNYDSVKGFPDWAIKTLDKHLKDKREYIYTKSQFEKAATHDEAWNAAQRQMVTTGKMHGYMRMYWAKKILEWTKHYKDALAIAIYLNDKYELDGRDPNGYVGVAWSIGGVHDRPWFEREIFGKIRYMNYNGLKRKFDIETYIKKFS